MKIAIPVWEGRISPVLDTADRFLVFTTREGIIVSSNEIYIGGKNLPEKARDIKHNADILICAALSQLIESCLISLGVEVRGWVMGNPERLVELYARGDVPGTELYMPGCGKRHSRGCTQRHRHGKPRRYGKNITGMKGNKNEGSSKFSGK